MTKQLNEDDLANWALEDLQNFNQFCHVVSHWDD